VGVDRLDKPPQHYRRSHLNWMLAPFRHSDAAVDLWDLSAACSRQIIAFSFSEQSPMTSGERMLSILPLFSEVHPTWTVPEAAEKLGIAGSTTYRHFRALSEAGLIVAYAAGRYGLGPAIIEYDRQIRVLDPLITAALPHMKDIASGLVNPGILLLCRIYGDRVMCVHQERGRQLEEFVSYERGRPMPLFRGAASKIIFAHLPARRSRALFERNRAEISASGLGETWDELKRNLRLIRNAGVCITTGELDPGLTGIAAPLFGPNKEVIGSLGAAINIGREHVSLVGSAKDELERAALNISEQLA
jgi:DNA-binding IclR family transcriptional regulator